MTPEDDLDRLLEELESAQPPVADAETADGQVDAIVDRVVSVSVMALAGGETAAKKAPARSAAPQGRLTRQDL